MEMKGMKPQLKKGLWQPEEDRVLKNYVEAHGEGNWASVSQKSGLMRGGKSCRLRWKNYLRPNIKRGKMSDEEKDLIIRLHKLLGNRWSLIAGRLPGRTDNEVKNYWNTHLNKRSSQGRTATICPKNKKKLRQLPNPQPICSRSLETNNEVSHAGKEEELTVKHLWMQDMKSFNFEVEPPFLPANNASFFYDESFMPIFDSLVLSEASYQIDGEENCQQEVSGYATSLW